MTIKYIFLALQLTVMLVQIGLMTWTLYRKHPIPTMINAMIFLLGLTTLSLVLYTIIIPL